MHYEMPINNFQTNRNDNLGIPSDQLKTNKH